MNRRRLLHLAALAATLQAVTPMAQAQTYPSKPIRFVVGFPAGGPNDILGRLIAQWLSEKLGQPFNVENKGGQSGNIATAEVVYAAPDGYTVLLVGPANALSPSLYPNLSFNFLRDIAPVAAMTHEPFVMVVHPSVPAKTVSEFLAYARANPGKVTMASTGTGSSPHVTGELFKQMAKIDLPIKQYGGGGPALKGMIAGESQMMFEPMSAAIEPVRRGELRAIGVTTTGRSLALPEVPTVAEGVPGYEASALTGIGVPKGTPAEAIAILNQAVQASFGDAGMKKKLADTGGSPLPGTPEDFAKMLAAETEKWGKVVKASGMKME